MHHVSCESVLDEKPDVVLNNINNKFCCVVACSDDMPICHCCWQLLLVLKYAPGLRLFGQVIHEHTGTYT